MLNKWKVNFLIWWHELWIKDLNNSVLMSNSLIEKYPNDMYLRDEKRQMLKKIGYHADKIKELSPK